MRIMNKKHLRKMYIFSNAELPQWNKPRQYETTIRKGGRV
jgi:hypothetical protein